jgi:hypothetical protein
MRTYRLNQLPPEYGLMGVERTLIFRLLEAGFKVKFLNETEEIHIWGKALHLCECEITFLGLPDIIQFINFVGKITIDLGSITMLEAELKRYNKYPEHPDVPDRIKD